jgi:hypothetical protein
MPHVADSDTRHMRAPTATLRPALLSAPQGRARGIPMGVVSGGEHAVVEKALGVCGIGDAFQVGAGRGDGTPSKTLGAWARVLSWTSAELAGRQPVGPVGCGSARSFARRVLQDSTAGLRKSCQALLIEWSGSHSTCSPIFTSLRPSAPPPLALDTRTHASQVVVSAKDVEHAKPAPDIYQLAAERLGVDPRGCVVSARLEQVW